MYCQYLRKNLFPAVVLVSVFMCFSATASNLTAESDTVIGLIDGGKSADAAAAVDKLITDNTADIEYSAKLFFVIAEKCRLCDKYEQEKYLYNQLSQNYPDSPYLGKAKLGFSRADVQTLILSGKYDQAKAAVAKIKSDFAANPDLPDALYWIAERYRWAHKWDQAKDLYKEIAQNHPSGPYTQKAQLGLARAEVLSAIDEQDHEKAQIALDKLITAFSSHPDMPETLYWIAREFGYKERHDKEKAIYQHIVINFPDSKFTEKARLGIERAKAQNLIVSGETANAEQAIVKIKEDFAANPDLDDAIYWIGKRYEWTDQYDAATNLYQQVIQNKPDSVLANRADIDISSANMLSNSQSLSSVQVQKNIDKLTKDFEDSKLLPEAVFYSGEKYFKKAAEKFNQGQKSQAESELMAAVKIWGGLIEKMPTCEKTADAHYYSAIAYEMLGEYGRSIEHYTRIVEDYPDYPLGWDAGFKIGRYYQNLKENDGFEKSTADNYTKVFYQQLVDKYPDCPAAEIANKWLKEHSN